MITKKKMEQALDDALTDRIKQAFGQLLIQHHQASADTQGVAFRNFLGQLKSAGDAYTKAYAALGDVVPDKPES